MWSDGKSTVWESDILSSNTTQVGINKCKSLHGSESLTHALSSVKWVMMRIREIMGMKALS